MDSLNNPPGKQRPPDLEALEKQTISVVLIQYLNLIYKLPITDFSDLTTLSTHTYIGTHY